MKFSEIVNSRHAAKRFDGRRVPAPELEELLELIRLAPTSYNLQPWCAVLVTDPGQKEALAKEAYDQPQISSCSHLLVFCANTGLEALADRLQERMLGAGTAPESCAAYLAQVRGMIARLGPERLAWAQRQTYLALANGLNGAKALGLDSCPMEGFSPAGFSEVLRLPEHLVPTALLAVGYAACEPRPKLRFSRDEMFFASCGAEATAVGGSCG